MTVSSSELNESDLEQAQFILWETLQNPLSINKQNTLSQIINIEENLIKLHKRPYFCSICQKNHSRGKLFFDHIGTAKPILHFLPIIFPQIETQLFMQIVGIYYTGNGDYIRALPRKTELELHPEPTNSHDPCAVSVWHDNRKLGYLPRGKNKPVFDMCSNNDQIICLLGRYRPHRDAYRSYFSHRNRWRNEDEWEETTSEFRPERADITIIVRDHIKLVEIIKGLIELVDLGHPNVTKNFASLGLDALRFLENYCESNQNPAYKQILSDIYTQYQIPIPGEVDISFML
jgi:hypothetical protein